MGRMRHGVTATLVVVILAIGLPVTALHAAAAIFDIGPPPKVLGCIINFANLEAFGSCATREVNDYAQDAVESASEAYETQISNLKSAHEAQVDTLEQQIAALQKQLDALQQQAAQTGAKSTQALQENALVVMSPVAPLQSNLVPGSLPGQLVTCLQDANANAQQVASNIASDPAGFTRTYMNNLWRKTMRASNTILGDINRLSTNANGSPKSVNQMLDDAERIMGRVAAQDPVGICLWAMVAPFRAQAKQIVGQIYPTLKAEYDASVKEVIQPAFERAMGDVLRQIFRKAPELAAGTARSTARFAGSALVPNHMKEIGFGVSVQFLIDPAKMARLKEDTDRLAAALTGPSSQIPASLAATERSLTAAMQFTDKMAVQVALATMRRYGHAIIDSTGRDMLDSFMAAAYSLKDGVAEVVTGIVALGYEPPSAFSEVIAFMIEEIFNLSAKPLKDQIIDVAHAGLDELIDAARQAARDNRPPSDYMNRAAGPFAFLLKDFPTERDLVQYALPQVRQIKDSLFAYHSAVLDLARSSARTRLPNRLPASVPTRPSTGR
ncbi:MAG TPA: hypothetical protein ENJ80_11005 [Gammaproteobacteria bacterium]|nr:hypothetical protein [Gammaproteobacteria bacterium]